MKNLRKIVGIALVMVIGLAFTTCDNGTTSDGGGGVSIPQMTGAAELELSGQVYVGNSTQAGYTTFNGNLTITDYNGGSGGITNGKLAYSIGTPTSMSAFNTTNIANEFGSGYTNVQVSNQNVQGLMFDYLQTSNGRLYKENETVSESNTSYSYTFEGVTYVYVDTDVTVSGKGITDSGTDYEDGYTINWTEKTNNFSLALKAGWNAIYTKIQESGTLTSSTTGNGTYTETISMGNPSLRWALWGGGYSGSMSPSIVPALEQRGLKKFGGILQKTLP